MSENWSDMLKIAQIKVKKAISLLRIMWLRAAGASIGRNVLIFGAPRIYNAHNLIIGDNVFLNDNFWCNAKGGVKIEKNVIIGPSVIIHSSNHNYSDPNRPIKLQGHTDKPVHIREDVWIGAGVTVLPGVSICSRVVLAAGAVVVASIDTPGVYGGVPAKILKKI